MIFIRQQIGVISIGCGRFLFKKMWFFIPPTYSASNSEGKWHPPTHPSTNTHMCTPGHFTKAEFGSSRVVVHVHGSYLEPSMFPTLLCWSFRNTNSSHGKGFYQKKPTPKPLHISLSFFLWKHKYVLTDPHTRSEEMEAQISAIQNDWKRWFRDFCLSVCLLVDGRWPRWLMFQGKVGVILLPACTFLTWMI